MKRDDLIFDIIEKEHQRQLKGIELIASENFVSEEVMKAMGSCMTNKYAEGYPGKRYYGGCEVVDQSEQLAIDRLKQIFGAEWAKRTASLRCTSQCGCIPRSVESGRQYIGFIGLTGTWRSPFSWFFGQHFRHHLHSV